MSRLLLIFAFLLMSSFAFSQEYDDMYFNKRDRKKVRQENYTLDHFSSKHVNPEYIARYTTKPKVKVQVRSYHRPYRYNHSRWNWNISFGYHYGWHNPYYSYWHYPYGWNDPFYYGYNYYSWYPYHYNSFFMRHNYYSWHYGYSPYYNSWN